jgi:hypothetical protein
MEPNPAALPCTVWMSQSDSTLKREVGFVFRLARIVNTRTETLQRGGGRMIQQVTAAFNE